MGNSRLLFLALLPTLHLTINALIVQNFPNIAQCMVLTDPPDGVIACSVGNDGVPSVGDTCTTECIGVVMTDGPRSRTCGTNGTWSSTSLVCGPGEIVIELILLNHDMYRYVYRIDVCVICN